MSRTKYFLIETGRFEIFIIGPNIFGPKLDRTKIFESNSLYLYLILIFNYKMCSFFILFLNLNIFYYLYISYI